VDRARLKGIAMINLDDVVAGTRELERAAKRGFAGAMITEYPLESRRYDQPEYEPFWAAAEALDMPLSLHTATRRQGKIRGAGERTIRDATSRSTKAFYPAISMCDLIFSGVFERYPRLEVAIVEFELAWAPHVLSSMDYTHRERHEARSIWRDAAGDFFHRNVCLPGDAITIRLGRSGSITMRGLTIHSESTFLSLERSWRRSSQECRRRLAKIAGGAARCRLDAACSGGEDISSGSTSVTWVVRSARCASLKSPTQGFDCLRSTTLESTARGYEPRGDRDPGAAAMDTSARPAAAPTARIAIPTPPVLLPSTLSTAARSASARAHKAKAWLVSSIGPRGLLRYADRRLLLIRARGPVSRSTSVWRTLPTIPNCCSPIPIWIGGRQAQRLAPRYADGGTACPDDWKHKSLVLTTGKRGGDPEDHSAP
jgi:hypothetical protein